MRTTTGLLVGLLLLLTSAGYAQQPMSVRKMGKLLREAADELTGSPGAWQLIFQDRVVLVLTDEAANRMRILTPVAEVTDLTEEEYQRMLAANFHSALDAKYALFDTYIISVYMHPLRELSDSQLLDALHQVVELADTFGTTYSSTDFIFGDDAVAPPPLPKLRNITRS